MGSPQEGHHLGTGHGHIGAEGGGTGAAGHAVVRRPQHRIIVVVAGAYIGEGIGLRHLTAGNDSEGGQIPNPSHSNGVAADAVRRIVLLDTIIENVQYMGIADLGQIGHGEGNSQRTVKAVDLYTIHFHGYIEHRRALVQQVRDGLIFAAGLVGNGNLDLIVGRYAIGHSGNSPGRQGNLAIAQIEEHIVVIVRCVCHAAHRQGNCGRTGGFDGDGRTLVGLLYCTLHLGIGHSAAAGGNADIIPGAADIGTAGTAAASILGHRHSTGGACRLVVIVATVKSCKDIVGCGVGEICGVGPIRVSDYGNGAVIARKVH